MLWKEFKINHLLSNVMQNNICGIAFSFWLAFLHDTETCSLKFNSWSTLTPRNFSYLLILTVSLPIFIWKLSLVLFMSKWYLSGFAFILLSLNYCNSFSAAFFNLIRTSEMLKPVQYGVLLSAYLATGMSWRTKRDRRKIYQVRKGQVQIFEAHQIKCLSVHCKCYSDVLFVTKTTNSKTLFWYR